MKKPKFPKPRMIREDIMPESNILYNYRVMKYKNRDGQDVYYPQYKFLGFLWLCLDATKTFYSFESAVKFINRDIIAHRKRKTEYLEVTEEDLKRSQEDHNLLPLNP